MAKAAVKTAEPGSFEEQLEDVQAAFVRAKTVDDVRNVFKTHKNTIGWRTLGKLFVGGYDIAKIAERREAREN